MNQTENRRDPALDIIRIFALFCVVGVHFFLNSGYYGVYIIGGRLYIATLLRTFFMICVPLFLMLSGYLLHHKKASKAYYAKLIPIIGEYILASLFCMAYYAITNAQSPADMVKTFFLQGFGILSFEAAKYSWYVNMYIGLFLFIPYLNKMYNGLESQKEKRNLIFTLLLLSGIPEVLNSVRFSLPWTMIYNDPSEFLTVFPNWWSNIYPITFYFIGAYLSDYPLKFSKKTTLFLSFAAMIIIGTYNYVLNLGKEFLHQPWQDHSSLFTVIQAVLVFQCLLNLDCTRIGFRGCRLLKRISDLCFCAYLVSHVYDKYFYNLFGTIVGKIINYPHYIVVLVPLVMICSLATSQVLAFVYGAIERAVKAGSKNKTRQTQG